MGEEGENRRLGRRETIDDWVEREDVECGVGRGECRVEEEEDEGKSTKRNETNL